MRQNRKKKKESEFLLWKPRVLLGEIKIHILKTFDKKYIIKYSDNPGSA